MKWMGPYRAHARGFASGSMALLLAAALSLQVFALLCACGDACAHKNFAAKHGPSAEHACCAGKSPSTPVDPSAPAISNECACARAVHDTVQAVQSAPATELGGLPAVVVAVASLSSPPYASPEAIPFASPPPIRALSLLNQSFRC